MKLSAESAKLLYPACKSCPYEHLEKVTGRGPAKCRLVFLAESPGREEHAQGKILIGQSGQLLDASCQRAGLGPIGETSYLLNATLCTPPDTEADKITAGGYCRSRVEEEILEREPELIVALGGFAVHSLGLDRKGVTRRIGQIEEWNGLKVLLNVHPAYLLRGGYDDYFTFLRGLKLAKRILSGEAPVSMQIDYTTADNRIEVLELLTHLQQKVEAGEELSLDLETSGFNPYAAIPIDKQGHFRKEEILLIILGTTEKSFLITKEGFFEAYDEIKRFLEQPKLKLIMHVSVFDAGFLWAAGIRAYPYRDTALEHYTLDERKYTHGLKTLAMLYFGAQDWEADIKQYLPSPKKSSYSLIPKAVLARYGSFDGIFTSKLARELTAELGDAEKHLLEKVIMPAQRAYLAARCRGIKIDVPRLLEIDNAIGPRMEELTEELGRIAGNPTLNPQSPTQLSKVIYDQLNLVRVEEITSLRKLKIGTAVKGLGERSTGEDALLELYPSDHPFVIALLEYRELQKDRSTYLLGMLPHMDEHNRIHPQIDFAATINGRIAANLPSVLNIKRPPEVITAYNDLRSIFIADEGWTLFEADQSQFELRIHAVLAQIEAMIKAFERDEDIHTFTDKLLDLNDRIRAKAVNFGIIYGLAMTSLAQRLGVNPQDRSPEGRKRMRHVEEVYQLIQQQMPGLKAYEEKTLTQVRQSGVLINPLGRKRRFPLITDVNWHKIRNEALNFPTSSTASDTNMLSFVDLSSREEDLKINLFWTIHDSIIGQIRTDYLHNLKEVAETMVSAPARHLGSPFDGVRYKVEIKTGQNWGHMSKLFELSS